MIKCSGQQAKVKQGKLSEYWVTVKVNDHRRGAKQLLLIVRKSRAREIVELRILPNSANNEKIYHFREFIAQFQQRNY